MTEKLQKMSFAFGIAFFGLILTFFLLSSCYYHSSGSGGTVPTSVTVRNIPPTVTSITLTISGEGMDTVTETIDPAETNYIVEVPAGTERLFELEILPAAESVFLTFTGSTTTDLVAGETVDVDITMEPMEARIVIPDAEHFGDNNGGRIVQVDDITGSNWLELEGLDFGFGITWEFIPADIDYDSQGRIYIANDSTSAGTNSVVRIDSFQDTTLEVIVTEAELSRASVIAIDHINNYIYYCNGSSPLYRKSLGPPLGAQESFDLLVEESAEISSFNTKGFDFDSDGYLYITNNQEDEIYKYNTNLGTPPRIVSTYISGNLNYPFDARVFGDYIIISNRDGADGYKVIVLDKNLALVNNFGNNPVVPTSPTTNEFNGPERFVGILNKKIRIIDETPMFAAPSDILISLDDISGNGWTSYGSTGTGIGQFRFFSAC